MSEDLVALLNLLVLIICIAIVFAVRTYNKLQGLRQDIREKASNLQVAISKKISIINQMIDLVKNYQQGEQFTQLRISKDENSENLTSAYQQSGTALTSVKAMANLFPDLKANQQYNNLSASITGCENEIQTRRVDYNDTVKSYNITRAKIPAVLFAKFMGYAEEQYLQLDTSGYTEANAVKEFKTDDVDRLKQLLDSNKNNP